MCPFGQERDAELGVAGADMQAVEHHGRVAVGDREASEQKAARLAAVILDVKAERERVSPCGEYVGSGGVLGICVGRRVATKTAPRRHIREAQVHEQIATLVEQSNDEALAACRNLLGRRDAEADEVAGRQRGCPARQRRNPCHRPVSRFGELAMPPGVLDPRERRAPPRVASRADVIARSPVT